MSHSIDRLNALIYTVIIGGDAMNLAAPPGLYRPDSYDSTVFFTAPFIVSYRYICNVEKVLRTDYLCYLRIN